MTDPVFVDRDANGNITGVYACPQYAGQEELPGDSPAIAAFLKPRPPMESGGVGFRAGITGYTNNVQPCGTFPNYYVPSFNFAYWDTSKRYDTQAMVWRPVFTGEPPRVVILGAQVTIMGGAAATRNPCFGIKLQKNGFQNFGLDIAAGQGFMDPGKPGWAYAQVTASAPAEPGDFFCAVVTASCWSAGDPPIPFPSPWAPGTFPPLGFDYCAIDTNQFHTYFWGVDPRP